MKKNIFTSIMNIRTAILQLKKVMRNKSGKSNKSSKKNLGIFNPMRNSTTGFTIIELLVVVAIIGILSSVALTQYNTVKTKSRDAQRMSDVTQIQKALSLYQIDNTRFPIHPSVITITGEDVFSTSLEASGAITEVPTDPRHPNTVYTYQSNSTGSDYNISFCLETDTIPNYSQGCGNLISP